LISVTYVLATAISFYTWLIIAYVLLSWFPVSGVLLDIYRVIANLVEPYLGIFRRFIPPVGMVDVSPIVAILVLQLIGRLVGNL
jgi:uncharacterized protein YggT (Ycf19 family)